MIKMNSHYCKLILVVLFIPTICNTIYAQRLSILDGMNDETLQTKIEKNITILLNTLNNANENNATKLTFEGVSINKKAQRDISLLWENEHFVCRDEQLAKNILVTANGYQIRGIPLDIYPVDDNNGKEYQEAVINLDKEGCVTSFRFTISPELYGTLGMEQLKKRENGVTLLKQRMIVLDFVEQFRTSYNQRDLNFLNKIFSDSALIITGTVIETRKTDVPLAQRGTQKKVIYKIKTKKKYLEDLERTFKTKSYINVEFDSVVISKHSNKDIYGVTVKQAWRTTNYNDDGYVFMLWDFRNPDRPEIRVRTWQPEFLDDKKKQRLNKDDVFTLGDFKF